MRSPVLPLVLAALVAASAAFAGPAVAQAPAAGEGDDDEAVRRDVEALKEQNEALRRRVEALEHERRPLGGPEAGAEAEAAAEGEAEPEQEEQRLAPLSGTWGDLSATLMLYGNVDAVYQDPPPPEAGSTTFSLGQTDFFGVLRWGAHWHGLGEIVIKYEAPTNRTEFELERIFVAYHFSDALALKVGREHTPIGYWNRAYHHGAWLHTTVDRPLVHAFTPSFYPIHSVGLEALGSFPMDPVRLSYVLGLANGRGKTAGETQKVRDRSSEKALYARLELAPLGEDHALGASVYWDEIPAAGGRTRNMREWVYAVYGVLALGDVRVLAEWIGVQRRDRSSEATFHHEGGYVQASYRIDDVTPYVRFEWLDVEDDDAFLERKSLDALGGIVGLRYDVHEHVALKGEYGYFRGDRDAEDLERVDMHRLAFQVAFSF